MLNHLKVLELASVLAGPSVGQFFAELGAEVIKVENLLTNGDVTRTWRSAGENTDDRSSYFCSVNWGKKSIALDLTSAEGKSIVQKLSSVSDIIISSYKPGDAEKLGVSYQQLAVNNPRLIYGQITGFGLESNRVGYDAVIQAESGFMDLNGEKSGPPTKMPVALIDVLAAHQLKEGILLALLNRTANGVGDYIEVSLIQTALSSLVNQASNFLVAGKEPKRQGSIHPNIAPYGEMFKTADDKLILLAIGTDRQFFDLCEILDIKRVDVEVNFNTNQDRVRNRRELAMLLANKFLSRKAADILTQIHHKKIPAGIIHSVPDALAIPQAKSLLISRDGINGLRNFVGHFTNNNRTASTVLLPPPHFGEHTDQLIASLGL